MVKKKALLGKVQWSSLGVRAYYRSGMQLGLILKPTVIPSLCGPCLMGQKLTQSLYMGLENQSFSG